MSYRYAQIIVTFHVSSLHVAIHWEHPVSTVPYATSMFNSHSLFKFNTNSRLWSALAVPPWLWIWNFAFRHIYAKCGEFVTSQ